MTRDSRFAILACVVAMLEAHVGLAQVHGTQAAAPQFRAVTAGADHMCGLTAGGAAWCWGANGFGQLGSGPASSDTRGPAPVAGGISFRRLSAGAGFTCGVTVDGDIYCWGLNLEGQLGTLTGERCQGLPCSTSAIRVEGPTRFDDVSAGFFHTCALADGFAYCWGANERGELGTPNATRCPGLECLSRPELVGTGLRFQVITARGGHTCGLSGGAIYCWGDNSNGEAGVGTTEPVVWTPRLVSAPVAFTDVKAGGIHTCALAVGGRVYCWGSNASGNLGTTIDEGSTVPVLVAGGRTFVALATGGAHTCAVASDRRVACWGSDEDEVLGAVTAERCGAAPCSTTPMQVADLRDVSQIAAGGNATCAIARDGVHCWGGTERLVIAARP